MRRPTSHICSLIFHLLTRLVPLPFLPVLAVIPYAMVHLFCVRSCELFVEIEFDDGRVEDGRVVGVEGDAFFGIEGHGGLAAFGEGDEVAVAGAEMVVNDERFS